MTQSPSPNKPGATVEGTRHYASRFAGHPGFFREAQGWTVSSLGLGTYLGEADDATDRAYQEAARTAFELGINFFDSAINYRNQRSEKALGRALADLPREEFVICTKAGFLTPGAVPDFLKSSDVAGGMHSMAPDFLADQIDRSRLNLNVDTIDVFYLHNPETQLRMVPSAEFGRRLRAAFERLERLADDRRIQYYGTATWDGYRKPGQLDLAAITDIARAVGGPSHRFRFVQLPFNLGMVEAFTNDPSVLEIAAREGITVVASASLMQAGVIGRTPEAVAELLPGLQTDAQRAIQFRRSTPGIAVALAGMSSPAHVRENAGIASVAPATPEQHARLFA